VYREAGAAAGQSPYTGAAGAYQGGEAYQPSPFTPTDTKQAPVAAGGYQPQSY